MPEESVKKRLRRARNAAGAIFRQAGYNVSLSGGVLEAKRKTETRRIMVFLSRRDIPKYLPPNCETMLKVGRNKFILF